MASLGYWTASTCWCNWPPRAVIARHMAAARMVQRARPGEVTNSEADVGALATEARLSAL